jgi:hypothetical protein
MVRAREDARYSITQIYARRESDIAAYSDNSSLARSNLLQRVCIDAAAEPQAVRCYEQNSIRSTAASRSVNPYLSLALSRVSPLLAPSRPRFAMQMQRELPVKDSRSSSVCGLRHAAAVSALARNTLARS